MDILNIKCLVCFIYNILDINISNILYNETKNRSCNVPFL